MTEWTKNYATGRIEHCEGEIRFYPKQYPNNAQNVISVHNTVDKYYVSIGCNPVMSIEKKYKTDYKSLIVLKHIFQLHEHLFPPTFPRESLEDIVWLYIDMQREQYEMEKKKAQNTKPEDEHFHCPLEQRCLRAKCQLKCQ